MKRIATLDGWRGIAILLVLFDHVQEAFDGSYLRPWTQTGQHGVTLFFVLSGFLITSKLCEGGIDLRRFYIRRFFRLMPVAWAFLGLIGVADLVVHGRLTEWPALLACALFYRNFTLYPGVTCHFWSLALEEQFYLVWPVVLLLAGHRRGRWIAGVGAALCASYRFLFWDQYNNNWFKGQSQVRADALLVGCLLALLLADPAVRGWALRWLKFGLLPSAAVLVFCMSRFHWLPPLTECVSIAVLIGGSIFYPGARFSRVMEFPPLAALGRVSYSIYVWQEIFMPFRNPWLLCFGLPIFVAGSYFLIEKPCNLFGHRLTSRSARPVKMVEAVLVS